MILIAHRGNTEGPNPKQENKPIYVLEALNKKYAAEVDAWWDNGWWLGHDNPQYKVKDDFIFFTPNLWVHCKNAEALMQCSFRKINDLTCPMYFWHENDTYALTSNNLLWTFPGRKLEHMSICVLPERADYTKKQLRTAIAICTDFPGRYKNL